MGRPKTTDDQVILEVARRLFSEKGHGISTREIAKEAGISEAVLYQRFASKDALFFTAMRPLEPEVEHILAPDAAALDARQRLVEVAARMLVYFRGVIPSFLHLLTHPAFDPRTHLQTYHEPPAKKLVHGIAALLEQLAAEGRVDPADPAAAAMLLVSAVHSVAMFEFLGHHAEVDARTAVRPLVDAAWRGLEGASAVKSSRPKSKKGAAR